MLFLKLLFLLPLPATVGWFAWNLDTVEERAALAQGERKRKWQEQRNRAGSGWRTRQPWEE